MLGSPQQMIWMCGIPHAWLKHFSNTLGVLDKIQHCDPVSNSKVITGTVKQVTRAEISARCHRACSLGKNRHQSVIMLLGGEGSARREAGNNTGQIKMQADCIQASKKTCSLAFKGVITCLMFMFIIIYKSYALVSGWTKGLFCTASKTNTFRLAQEVCRCGFAQQ